MNKTEILDGSEDLSPKHLEVLDYVRNYPDRYRIEYFLVDYSKELADLRKKGWIEETQETDYSGFTWNRLRISGPLREKLDKILDERRYSTLTPDVLRNHIEDLYKSHRDSCIRSYNWLKSISVSHISGGIVPTSFLAEMSKKELGYYVRYSTSNRYNRTSEMELHFRSIPLDVGKLFQETIARLLKLEVQDMSDEDVWVIYLKRNLEQFDFSSVKNNPRFYMPGTLQRSYEKVSEFPEHEAAVLRVKEDLEERFSALSRKDENLFHCLSVLLVLSTSTNDQVTISYEKLQKLKRLDSKLDDYLNPLQTHGFLLKDRDNLVITAIVKSIIDERLTGIYTTAHLVETRIQAREILDEILGSSMNLKVWDPFISRRTVEVVSRYVRPGAEIKILGSRLEDPYSNSDLTKLKEDIKRLRSERNIKLILKLIWYPEDNRAFFHDRFIISPSTTYQLGSSINFLGKKLTWISELRGDWKLKIDTSFDYHWNTPTKILKDRYHGVDIIRL